MNVQTCSYVKRLIKRVHHTVLIRIWTFITSKEVFGRDELGFQDACPFLVLQKKGSDMKSILDLMIFNFFGILGKLKPSEINDRIAIILIMTRK